jgi:hypothetical protein
MKWIFSWLVALSFVLPVSASAWLDWTIDANVGVNLGTITPSGTVVVDTGTSHTFSIAPYNSGYAISHLVVDSAIMPKSSSHTFTGVNANHTIVANFTDLGTTVKGFSDIFDGPAINPYWIFVSPNADSAVSLPGNGTLRISASPKNGGSDYATSTNRNAPRLLQFIGFTPFDWQVETKIVFSPDPSSGASQGVAVLACPSAAVTDFSDCRLFAERNHLGPGNDNVMAAGGFVPFSGSTVHFKLQRYGQVYKGWYSSDGAVWTPGGEFTDPANIYYLGIMGMRQPDDGDMTQYATAEVDYFKVSSVYNATVTLAGSGSGSVSSGLLDCASGSCSERFLSGTVLNFQPSPAAGAVFAGWTGCDTVTGDICTINVTAARSVRAFFNSVVGQAVALTDNGDNDDNPNVVHDPSGALHLAYGKTGSIYYRKKTAGIWSDDEVVASGIYPALAVDPSGTPHVTYASGNSILYTKRSGGAWITPQYVAAGQKSSLDLDVNGIAHIVLQDSSWNPSEPSDYYNEIYYTSNAAGPFASPTRIADGGLRSYCWGGSRIEDFFDPVIKVAAPGVVHVAYRDDYQDCGAHSEWIRYWSSSGAQIDSPAHANYMYLSRNALSLDDSGNAWLAYTSSAGNAYVGSIAGGVWTEEVFPGTAASVGGSVQNSSVHFAFVNSGTVNFSTRSGGFSTTYSLGTLPFSPQAISLAPAAAGSVCMAITGNDGADSELYLVSSGAAATASPASGDFGVTPTGGESGSFAFTIRNSGSQPLDVARFSLAGAGPASFRISGDSCGVRLPPAATCSVSVSFAPVSAGVKTAAVTVVTSDPDAPAVSLGLRGTAVVPPDTTITAAPPPWSGSTTAGFGFEASGSGWGFRCRLDGGADAACTNPQLYTGLAEGPHTFEVFASNGAGIADPTPATFSWTINLTSHVLSISLPGTGKGSVANTVYGLSCNTGCSAPLPAGAEILLRAAPEAYSFFSGWSGAGCEGTGDCIFVVTAPVTVTASFDYDLAHQVRATTASGSTYHSSIEAAYGSSAKGCIIDLWETTYPETLVLGQSVPVTLVGGFDHAYSTRNGTAAIRGSLTVGKGSLVVDGIAIY